MLFSKLPRIRIWKSVLSVQEQQLLNHSWICYFMTSSLLNFLFDFTKTIRSTSVECHFLTRPGHSPTSMRFPSAPTWSHSGS